MTAPLMSCSPWTEIQMVDEGLRDELLARAERDQAVRTVMSQAEPWPADLVEQMRAVDDDNAAFLRAVVAEHGWPGRDLVGADGAQAAWLLCQHATGDVEFQRRCLDLLAEAVAVGQAESRHLAYLTDRVLVMQGRPQVYGTQYRRSGDSELGPHPIEEADSVDERRAKVGLGPLAEYDRQLRDFNGG
jgi:hypothetical protein